MRFLRIMRFAYAPVRFAHKNKWRIIIMALSRRVARMMVWRRIIADDEYARWRKTARARLFARAGRARFRARARFIARALALARARARRHGVCAAHCARAHQQLVLARA